MDTATLLAQLRKERDELSATISVLEKRTGSGAAPKHGTAAKPHGRVWTAADRAKMSKLIKARLAAKKTKATRKTARKPKQAPKALTQS